MKRKPPRQNDQEWNNFLLSLRRKNMSRRVMDTLNDFDESNVDFNLVLTLIRHIVKSTPEVNSYYIFMCLLLEK